MSTTRINTKNTIVASISEGAIAPMLEGLDPKNVQKFLREREHYLIEGKRYALLLDKPWTQIKTSVKAKVLSIDVMRKWAKVELGMIWDTMAPKVFKIALRNIAKESEKDHRDMDSVLKERISMDFSMTHVKTRIFNYMCLVDRVIEEEGFKDMIMPDTVDAEGNPIPDDLKDNAKYCSILLEYLAPVTLKTKIKTMLTCKGYKQHKKDANLLYKLIVEEAVRQQQNHDYATNHHGKKANNKRTTEDSDRRGKSPLKKLRQDNPKNKGQGRNRDKGDKKKSTDPKDAPAELAKLVAKDNGCFMCGGEHAVSKHPGITKAQVNALWDKHYAAKGQTNPFKRALLKKLADTEDFECSDDAPPKFKVLINGVYEMPALADCGARSQAAISRNHVEGLCKLDQSVKLINLKQPIEFQAAGGHVITSKQMVKIKVDIYTTAGVISSYRPIECCIIEEEEGDFLITDSMLKKVGINVDAQLEAISKTLQDIRHVPDGKDGDDIVNPRLEQEVVDHIDRELLQEAVDQFI